ncbi:hypothetical protein CI610_00995 [invertebrate metagenome]|uniref:Cytochrome c-type biogenesis protein H TPR domain-containing protein n=1 Tax=invertebrate metagenome TaxID=1711999 RepID=A0A2H9T9Y9_9ZZZZ
MTFWITAGLLTIIAILITYGPLLRQKRLRDISLFTLLFFIIPASSFGLYSFLGASTSIRVAQILNNPDATAIMIEEALLKWHTENPDNTQAEFLLGSHYLTTGRPAIASRYFSDLHKNNNKQPQISAQYAQALFLSHNNVITDKVRYLIRESLTLDKNNTIALGLQGIDYFEQNFYQEAISSWQTALLHEQDMYARKALQAGIQQAEQMIKNTHSQIIESNINQ